MIPTSTNMGTKTSRLNESNNLFANLETIVQDPISLGYMQDPRIDPHGHTFDLCTIDDLVKKSLNNHLNEEKGKGFMCPLTDEWVKLSELYPNLLAKNITEELQGGLEEKISKVLNQKFEQMQSGCKAALAILEARCERLGEENKFLLQKFDNYRHECAEKDQKLKEQESLATKQNEWNRLFLLGAGVATTAYFVISKINTIKK